MTYQLSETAERICQKRYYCRDAEGQIIENWSGLVDRVVNFVCKNETQQFRDTMRDLIYHTQFVPNSPCLANAGKEGCGGLCACFVSPSPEDSWTGIIGCIKDFGDVARRGGGNGTCFSNIRPLGSRVFKSTHARACGPVQVMRIVSEAMHGITQSAGFRGMANMGTLHISHPDIVEFILCKQKEAALRTLLHEDISGHYDRMINSNNEFLNVLLDKHISNFNISVMASDAFMQAVENDADWDLMFNGVHYRTVKARWLFNLIVENAHKNGDPGLLFDDAINRGPYHYSGQRIEATNPCGEEPMPGFAVCDLGSIDISKFYDPVNNDVAWVRFGQVIKHCVRFLDNVIDCNVFPTDAFREWAMRNRPIGLGIMGWADLLLKLGIAYGSDESIRLGERVAQFLETHAEHASIQLAVERGTPEACDYRELNHRRNITITSIAPTGSISQLANCSSSIEPIYAPVTYRQDNTGKSSISHLYADQPHFRCAVDKNDSSREVTWEQHVRMQAAFQKYGSSGISKTINMPNSATTEDVHNAYMLAWKLGCKGITIYRDGCKTVQVLNTGHEQSDTFKRPKSLPADIIRGKSDGIEWYLIIGLSDNSPYELFAVSADGLKLPENGHIVKVKKRHYQLTDIDGNVLVENLSDEEQKVDEKVGHEAKRFSLEFRHGIPLKFILKQIDQSSQSIVSFSKVVGRTFKSRYLTQADQCSIVGVECPECKRNGQSVAVISEAGCTKCPQCFYSKCG